MLVCIIVSPGMTGADEPPGITALIFLPPRMPPASSSSFENGAEGNFEVAGTFNVAGHREQLGAAIVGQAKVQEGFAALAHDPWHCGKCLSVVDRRRFAIQAEACRERRLEARLAFCLQSTPEARSLRRRCTPVTVKRVQLEIKAGTENIVAEEPAARASSSASSNCS